MNRLYTVTELVQLTRERGRPVTGGYIRRLFRAQRVPGAVKVGRTWALPAPYAERWLDQWSKAE